MRKNFDLDAKRLADIIGRQDNNLQIGLLSGVIDQTIHHHVTEESVNDDYDRIILRGGKILDKYEPSDKKTLLQKVSDILYLEHEGSKKFLQNQLDSETALLPTIATFKADIIDFTALAPAPPSAPQSEPEEA